MNIEKDKMLLRLVNPVVCVFCIASVFYLTLQSHAQNYYPDEFGNTWRLRSTDGVEEKIVTIEGPEIVNGEDVRIIMDQSPDDLSKLYVKTEPDGIKLHRLVAEVPLIGEVVYDITPPQDYLPNPLDLGTKWTIEGEASVPLLGTIQSIIESEVVAIDDVTVPAGSFPNSLKIEQKITNVVLIGNVEVEMTMWLAPNVGIVKTIDRRDVTFELFSYDVATEEIEIAVQPKDNLATVWGALKIE